jgi:phosphatidylinositol-3-phosphatase
VIGTALAVAAIGSASAIAFLGRQHAAAPASRPSAVSLVGPTGSASTSAGSEATAAPTTVASPTVASTSPAPPTARPTPTPSRPPAHAPHVMVVMLENKGYPATLGACSAADPYLCSLASTYASATSWFGLRHPSLPNYLAATTGSTEGCTSDACIGPYSPSLGGQLNNAGIPWIGWFESMPSACTTTDVGVYERHHNPFSYESDSGCAIHDVPYPGVSRAVSILDGANPPDFVWLGPDANHNMHEPATVQAGDAWLQGNIAPILASSWFTQGNATVVITMDEFTGDNTNGGGHIPLVVIPSSARGNAAAPGNHYGLLRTIEEVYGLPLLGNAGNAANGDLRRLFG